MSISEQTWDTYTASQRSPDGGRSAERDHNIQTHRIAHLQQMEKDVVLPADVHGRQAAKETTSTVRGIQLPTPSSQWSAFQDSGKQQEGLIAIIGAVLVLQARTSSNFWSTMWKQATAFLNSQLSLAKPIGDAIVAQYKAQSDATQQDAQKEMWDGIINCAAFGVTVAMGVAGYIRELPETLPKTEYTPHETDEEEEAASAAATKATGSSAEDLAEEMEQTEQNTINNTGKNANTSGRTQDIGESWMKRGLKAFGKFMKPAYEAAQFVTPLSSGLSNLAVNQYFDNKKAGFEKDQGTQAALSKKAEMYAQNDGQNFSRAEEMRQQAGQNGIEYTMNIFQQAANGLTAVVRSMYGG